MDAITAVIAPIADPLAKLGVPPIATLAILAVVVLFILRVVLGGGKAGGLIAKRDTVLLLGQTGGGKSVLFHQLQFGKFVETHTSMREVEATFPVSGQTVHVVDIPGHPRLRALVNDFVPVTKGIVYVIDSTKIKTDLRDTADFLYSILTNETFVNNGVSVQLVCNKQDLTATAKSARFVKMALQRELDELCKSKAASPDQVGDDEGERLLVDAGETFKFADAPLDVEFLEASIKTGAGDKGYDQVEEFVSRV